MPYYPPASGGGGYNLVQDEGTSLAVRTTLDFVGAGVTASDVAGETQISIPGGGTPSSTTVEVNLGATPVWQGKFTITDAAISTSSKVHVWQAPGPYTGKGIRADEAALQPVDIIAVEPLTGSASVHWQTPPMLTQRSGLLSGGGEKVNVSTFNITNYPQDRYETCRLGKISGNVKFTYQILA